jgi:PKD repeat protein
VPGAIFGTVWGVWATRTVGRLQVGVLAVALGVLGAPAAAAAAPPTAAFDMSRTVAEVGERVTFTDRSTDDGMIVRRGWDINGDGIITDQSGPPQVSRPYNEPGCVNIMLRVTDDSGDTSEVIRVLTVVPKGAQRTPCPGATPNPPPPPPGPSSPPTPPPSPTSIPTSNRAPSASFSFAPATPGVGQAVFFTSSSSDPDGAIASQAWDLDGDGAFDDGTRPTAQMAYSTAGPRIVSLRVMDGNGAFSVTFQTVVVSGDAQNAGAGQPSAPAPRARRRATPLRALVRIRGLILPDTVRVQVLTVQASSGSTIVVRCDGRGCPFATARARTRSYERAVRIKRLQRRLPVGTVIRVMVTKSGRIGKYTRFRIRRGAAPDRRDLCLRHGSTRPFRCRG